MYIKLQSQPRLGYCGKCGFASLLGDSDTKRTTSVLGSTQGGPMPRARAKPNLSLHRRTQRTAFRACPGAGASSNAQAVCCPLSGEANPQQQTTQVVRGSVSPQRSLTNYTGLTSSKRRGRRLGEEPKFLPNSARPNAKR